MWSEIKGRKGTVPRSKLGSGMAVENFALNANVWSRGCTDRTIMVPM